MQNRQLTVNFITNLVSVALNAGILLFITPYLIANVGSEAYSFIPIANNFVNYTYILTSALNSVASRFISIEINSNNNEQANVFFNSVLRANTIIACVLTVPAVLTVLYIYRLINVPVEIVRDVQLTFSFVFTGMIIALLGNVFSAATFCKNRMDLSSLRSIEGSLLKLACTILLFSLLTPKIYFISLTSVFATVYTVITNMYYTKKLLPEVGVSFKKFSGKAVKSLISSGIWNSVNQLSVVLLSGLDLMICNILIGSMQGGQYAVAKTIPTFIQFIVGSVVSVFMPQFTILFAQGKAKELLRSVNFSMKAVGLIVMIPVSFLAVFGDVFFTLWTPGEDAKFLFLLSTLTILPMCVTGSIEPIFNIYTVTNKLKTPALMLLVSGIVNTVTVVVLLKTTGLGIIAIPLTAIVIGLLRNLIFTPIYAAHCLKAKWWSFYKSVLRGAVCSAVTIAISMAFKRTVTVDSWIGFILAAAICGSVALAINSFIMFDRMDIMNVINTLAPKGLLLKLRILLIKNKIKRAKNSDKIIFLFCVPQHGNTGDHAITEAELLFFNNYFPGYTVVQVQLFVFGGQMHVLKDIVGGRAMFISGGGSMGTLWPEVEDEFKEIIGVFKDNPIIMLPQTVYYEDSEWGREQLNESARIYGASKRMTLFARDAESFEFMKKTFIHNSVYLAPDIALYLKKDGQNINRRGILLCLRADKESVLSDDVKNMLYDVAKEYSSSVRFTDTVIDARVTDSVRKKRLNNKLMEFAGAELIITDRLHGMIFSAITGTPCIAFDNVSHKVSGAYEWLKLIGYIHFCATAEDIRAPIRELVKMKGCVYDVEILKPHFDRMAETINLLLGTDGL